MMYDRRMRQATRLAFLTTEESVGNPTDTNWRTRSANPQENRAEDSQATTIEQALRDYFEAQRDTFPYEHILELLDSLVQSDLSQTLEENIQAEVEAALLEWSEREHAQAERALEKALHAAAVSGFLLAFNGWRKRFGLNVKPTSDAMVGLVDWAKRRAVRLIALLNKSTCKGIIDIILRGLKEGLPPKEILRRIRAYFDSLIIGRAMRTARAEAGEAANQGAFEANRVIGAATKQWFTCGDDRVCAICLENEAQGPIPIGCAFASGVQHPWAHFLCRCEVEYYGVTRMSLLQSLGLLP